MTARGEVSGKALNHDSARRHKPNHASQYTVPLDTLERNPDLDARLGTRLGVRS